MRAIILTGSTGGLGRSLARVLASENESDLICLYRNMKKYEAFCRETNESFCGYFIKEKDDFSGLLELIQNGGYESVLLILTAFSISPLKRIGDFEVAEIENFIYGNLTRNLVLLNSIVGLCKRNLLDLRIINLDSGAADFPLNGWGNYCSAKSYMNSFLSVISAENPGFQIVSFDPGVMDTNMQAEIRSVDISIFDQVGIFKGYKEKGKLHDPSDVARQIKERYIDDWKALSLREKYR